MLIKIKKSQFSEIRILTLLLKSSLLLKHTFYQFLLASVLILLTFPVGATTYYVSTTGNDANAGTSANLPWKTLTKVNNLTPKPGDQILFKRGDTWTGTIAVKASGTSISPITYGAYGTGKNPVISGFTSVTGWTNDGGGIYSKVINPKSAPNMLIIDGVQYAIGRYPNNSNLVYESANTNLSITDKELAGTPNWTGAEVVIFKNIWTIDRCIITNHNTGSLTYTSLGTTNNASAGEEYFIQNNIKTLDQFGEWYYNKSTKKLSVFFGATDPTIKITKVSVTENLLTNSANDYIVLDNLAFDGSNSSSVKFLSGTDNCLLKNCNISFSGYDAFTLSGNKITVDNCSVSNVNGGGIVINGANALITNNSLSGIGLIPGQSNMLISTIAITMNGNYPTVQYNTIDSTAYMGIYFTPSTVKGVIHYNRLNSTSQLRHDSGSIYLGHDHPGTLVDHNIISNAGGNGIYLDEFCTGVTVTNNTIFASADNGIKIHRSSSNIIKNNTLHDNSVGINFTNWTTVKTVYSNIVSENISVAKPNQFVAEIVNRYAGDNTFGSANNNYYVYPDYANKAFQVNVVGNNSIKTLAEWITVTKTDLTSHSSPQKIEDVEFYYNETSVARTIALNNPMINIKGTKYSSNITLQPYTSAVLMKDLNPVLADLTKPVITAFIIPAYSSSLVVPINKFTAVYKQSVTGYKLTESATTPLASVAGWTTTAPTTHAFTSMGTKKLYAWAKDATGKVSASASAQVVIQKRLGYTEVYSGTSTGGTRQAMSVILSETGEINSITIYHNGGTGNLILAVYSDKSGFPSARMSVTASTNVNSFAGWQTVPLTYPVNVNSGQKVWLSWVFQNNVVIRYTAGIPGRASSSGTWSTGMPSTFGTSTIANNKFSIYCNYLSIKDLYDVIKPAVSTFSIPSTSTSLIVPINSFTASDNKAVTGYKITETSITPLASNSGWLASAPASYTFTTAGTKSLYAWVKDAAGNVSASAYDQVVITLPSGNEITVGNTIVYSNTLKWGNQLAMPVTFTEAGEIKSISIYHDGGNGNFLLAVYSDMSGYPSSRLKVTASTAVNPKAGWQTIQFSTPVSVISGQKVWLSWVFQNTPGIRYTSGAPGRAASSNTWANGMPATFGASTIASNKYSIYCTYTVNTTALKNATIQEDINAEPTQTISNEEINMAANEISVENSVIPLDVNDFKLYPNPAKSHINVDYLNIPVNETIIEIIDINGIRVYSQVAQHTSNKIDINYLKPGLYIIRSTNIKGMEVKKLIVE